MPEEKEKSIEEKYPSNAYTNITPKKLQDREDGGGNNETEKVKKKFSGKVKKKKLGERIADSFLMADRQDLKEHLFFDWFIPEVKAVIEDVVHMLLYGTSGGGGRSRKKDKGIGRLIDYAGVYDEKKKNRDREVDPTRQNFRRIKLRFDSREEANEVIDEMRESLAANSAGYVTVKELYSFLNEPTNYTMSRWGWYDLEDAMITRFRDDFILEMPSAEVIK